MAESDFVDVAVNEAVVDLAVEAHHLGGPRAGASQHCEGGVVELAKFAVDPDEGPFRGGMASGRATRRSETGCCSCVMRAWKFASRS